MIIIIIVADGASGPPAHPLLLVLLDKVISPHQTRPQLQPMFMRPGGWKMGTEGAEAFTWSAWPREVLLPTTSTLASMPLPASQAFANTKATTTTASATRPSRPFRSSSLSRSFSLKRMTVIAGHQYRRRRQLDSVVSLIAFAHRYFATDSKPGDDTPNADNNTKGEAQKKADGSDEAKAKEGEAEGETANAEAGEAKPDDKDKQKEKPTPAEELIFDLKEVVESPEYKRAKEVFVTRLLEEDSRRRDLLSPGLKPQDSRSFSDGLKSAGLPDYSIPEWIALSGKLLTTSRMFALILAILILNALFWVWKCTILGLVWFGLESVLNLTGVIAF